MYFYFLFLKENSFFYIAIINCKVAYTLCVKCVCVDEWNNGFITSPNSDVEFKQVSFVVILMYFKCSLQLALKSAGNSIKQFVFRSLNPGGVAYNTESVKPICNRLEMIWVWNNVHHPPEVTDDVSLCVKIYMILRRKKQRKEYNLSIIYFQSSCLVYNLTWDHFKIC